MAFSHGSTAALLINGRELSTYLTDIGIDASRDMHDTSVLGASAKAFYPSPLKAATWTASGFWEGTTAVTSFDAWCETFLGLTGGDVVSYFPYGYGTVGNRCKGLLSLATTYSMKAAVSGVQTVSLAGQSSTTGPEPCIVLHGLTQETATGSGTTHNNTAATSSGGIAYLHVSAGTAGTLDVKLQHSTNGSSWVDIPTGAAFTQVGYAAAPTAQRLVIPTQAINQYVRAAWTIATGPFTFAVTFDRLTP